MLGFWNELGIPHTTDATTIRRAYAAQLKTVRPDTDPQGFARLRAAYEQALATARTAAPSRSNLVPFLSPPLPEAATHAPVQPAADGPAPDPNSRPELDPIESLLRQNDVVGAAEWLLQMRAAGSLTLASDLRLADRLGWAMVHNRTLPAGAVREATERLGWPKNVSSARWAGALGGRLDAECWLKALHRASTSRTRWLCHAAPIVARMMLGRGRPGVSMLIYADPRLKQRYGEYLLHAPVVGDQFDPVRVEAIGRLVTLRAHPWVGKVFGTFGLLMIAGGTGALAGQAAAAVDPRLQDGITAVVAISLVSLLLVPTVRHRLDRMLRRYNRR